jgi:hypothetical protein
MISGHICPVLPMEQAMFPARHATDAHAQDFTANDDCYYSSCWKSHSTLAHYTLPKKDYVLSLCGSKTVCSYQKQSPEPRHAPTRPEGIMSRSVVCIQADNIFHCDMAFILPATFCAVEKSARFFFSAIVSGKQKYITKK